MLEKFFTKYGIRPKYHHENCEHYVATETDSWCAVSENAKLSGKCIYVEKEYPTIDSEKLIQLICIASGLFPMTFAFERGEVDVRTKVLEALTNYDGDIEYAKRSIKRVFGRK